MTSEIAGPRVLIIEDEMMIATGIELTLTNAGYSVAGPIGRLDKAVKAVAVEAVDAALLDVNLRGETVYPVADILIARGIPFTFLTGYGRETLPERYDKMPVLRKPFQAKQLITAVGDMLLPAAASIPLKEH